MTWPLNGSEAGGDLVLIRFQYLVLIEKAKSKAKVTSNIKIAHLNINSIQNKLDEVKDMLNRNMFDILFIGETELDRMFSSSLLYHPGYRIVRRDRKKRCRRINGVHTGGLVCLQAA